MKSLQIRWPQALFLGFAALLIATGAWATGQHASVSEVAESGAAIEVPVGAFSGHPDLRPLDHNRRVQPTAGILPHPQKRKPEDAVCAVYDHADTFQEVHNPTGTELVWEGWEKASASPGSYCLGTGYFDKFGDSSLCYDPGFIKDGITAREDPPRPASGLLAAGKGFLGLPTKNNIVNYFVDSEMIYFDDPRGMGNSAVVSAFSAYFHNIYTGAEQEVTFYLSDGSEYAVTVAAETSGQHFGICCDPGYAINRVDVFSTGSYPDQGEGVDSIWFGDYGVCGVGDVEPDMDDIHDALDVLEFKLDGEEPPDPGGSLNYGRPRSR